MPQAEQREQFLTMAKTWDRLAEQREITSRTDLGPRPKGLQSEQAAKKSPVSQCGWRGSITESRALDAQRQVRMTIKRVSAAAVNHIP